VSVNGI